jgi:hypothetical protein
MQTRIYQLYSTASQANAANFTIIARGVLTAVKWVVSQDSLSDNALVSAELSFQQTSQLATTGAVGVVDSVVLFQNVQAAPVGQSFNSVNQLTNGLRIPVVPGNILYLNTSNSGGAVKALVFVQE